MISDLNLFKFPATIDFQVFSTKSEINLNSWKKTACFLLYKCNCSEMQKIRKNTDFEKFAIIFKCSLYHFDQLKKTKYNMLST